MGRNLTRRQFLKLLAVALGAGGIAIKSLGQSSLAQSINRTIFLPWVSGHKAQPTATSTPTGTLQPTSTIQPTNPTQTGTATVTNTPTPVGTPGPLTGKVVHVHSVNATYWNFTDPHYWDYVNQDVINQMIDDGLMELTNTTSVDDAWRVLLPAYQEGQGIALKANFNNAWSCADDSGDINSIIQVINSIVRGLKSIGVREQDVWVYDAIRAIPDYFVAGSLYPYIRFFDNGCRNIAGFDKGEKVYFYPPDGLEIPPIGITDVLVNATYVINVPIMKSHTLTGVSLGYKNHFGSISNPGALHDYVGLNSGSYNPLYSPLVDLWNNTHIRSKTVLTIGDGVFAAKYYSGAPQKWVTFGNTLPNSLFFAMDSVAIDCVMSDFVDAELSILDSTYDYLVLAADAGLGVFERGDPWGNGYNTLDYRYLEL